METPTTQEITNHIQSAFDSVNLINEEIQKTITDEIKNTVERNVDHLEIMLTKEWFSDGLTVDQRNNIDNAIADGKLYIG
jgi:hypothetical protein